MADSPLGVKSRGGPSDSPQVSRTRFDCHDDEDEDADADDDDNDNHDDVKVWPNNSSASACDRTVPHGVCRR